MIAKLRQNFKLELLLEIAQLPRATYYYHAKRIDGADKYAAEKEEMTSIFHEHRGRYGYRRVTTELRNRGYAINHKTVQRLMRELGLTCRVRIKNTHPTKARWELSHQICWNAILKREGRIKNG